MGFVLKDGRGTGESAGINSLGELLTRSTTRSEMETVSQNSGLTFSWSNVTYDYAAADTILLVKNTSAIDLHVSDVIISGDTATEVIVHSPDSVTTPTGTAVTGTNLNRTSGNVAAATAIATETTNTQANVVARVRIAANDEHVIELGGALVLGSNDSVAVDFVTDGAACNVTILGYFD